MNAFHFMLADHDDMSQTAIKEIIRKAKKKKIQARARDRTGDLAQSMLWVNPKRESYH